LSTVLYLNKEPALQANSPVSAFTSFRIKLRKVVILFAMISISTFLSGCKLPWSNDDESSSILLSGTIEARETDLAFQVPGRIAHLLVDEGDVISAGQKVANLEPHDYELAMARARAEADVSKANLTLLEAGTRQQELMVAKAAVTRAKAQLKFAQSETHRIAQLVEKQLSSQDQLDRAHLEEDLAQAALTQSREQLALLQEGTREEEIAKARADYEVRQQAVSIAKQQLSYVDLTSPVAGSITVRLAEAGEVVATGQAVFRVASLEHPWVRVYINEKDLPRIKLGQTAEVRVDGLSNKVFEGRVVFISPKAEFTPKTVETRDLRIDLVYRIKVEVDNPAGILKIGMPADVTLTPATS
jgi:HlyD family secretion protein